MRSRTLLLLGLLLLFSGGCGRRHLATAPEIQALDLKQEATIDKGRNRGAASIIGKRPDGSLYALYRPARWNGDLVLYAHGFIAPGTPITLPETSDNLAQLRDALLAEGFAIAYSSFSQTGLAIQDGIQHTRQLGPLFARRLGKPERTFLLGHSMGGLIGLALAERDPDAYDGALLISGILGGSRAQIDYVANVRLLFDYFYPGVLPGDLLHFPPGTNLNTQFIGPAVAAMQAHPEGAFAISQIVQTPVPFASGEELVGSIVRALSLQAIEAGDLLQRTGGESFFDNSNTTYTGALPAPLLADINARLPRFQASRRVDRFYDRFYQPTGCLEIPVLSLSNRRDPVVPGFNETLYRNLVKARGNSDLLVQEVDERYGHTGFSIERTVAAFEVLVEWAEKDGKRGRRLLAVGE